MKAMYLEYMGIAHTRTQTHMYVLFRQFRPTLILNHRALTLLCSLKHIPGSGLRLELLQLSPGQHGRPPRGQELRALPRQHLAQLLRLHGPVNDVIKGNPFSCLPSFPLGLHAGQVSMARCQVARWPGGHKLWALPRWHSAELLRMALHGPRMHPSS